MAIKQANAVNPAATPETEVETQTKQTAEVEVETVAEDAVVETQAQTETVVEEAQAEATVEDRATASAAVLDDELPEDPAPQASAPQTGAGTEVQAAVDKPVALHKTGGFLAEIMQSLGEDGFEGTELDYSSFLNVILNKQIETSEGQELPNSGFLVRLASSRKKYCFRNNNTIEDEVEVAYSYDINAPQDPESQVAKSIAKWKEEGLDLAPGKDGVKEYLEVLAQIIDDKIEGEGAGELTGKLITIQIAPTSQGRWAGYLVQLKLAKKSISEVLTLVRRGKKVEGGKFPFYPWDFVNKGAIES